MSLAVLKNKRKFIKSSVTRFNTFLAKLKNQQSEVKEVEARLNKIKPLLDEYIQIQCEISAMQVDVDEAESEEESQTAAFEDSYYRALAVAEDFLGRYKAAETPVTNSNQISVNHNNASSTQTNSLEVKLPTISIASFNGDIADWSAFYETFNSLIHSKSNLSDIQKFHYLRSVLTGTAASVIESLEVSATNYHNAWSLLKDRFENKRLILNNHVNALFNLPHMQKEPCSTLRSLLDSLSKHLRALESLNQPVDKWDALIIHLVATRLDPITRRDWERQNFKGTFPTINELKAFLQTKCRLLETLEQSKGPEVRSKQIKACNAVVKQTCPICKTSNHLIYHCEKFRSLSVDDRITQVKRLKLCFNCLRSNHSSSECKSTTCKTCQKRHNTLLHLSKSNNMSLDPVGAEVRQPSQSQPSNETSEVSAVANQSANSQYVLLSTALIWVIAPNGFKHKCRALLDSASQSSFITKEMCDRLQLKTSQVQLTVSGISQSVANISNKAQIKIRSVHNMFTDNLQVLVLPRITDPIPSINIERSSFKIPPNIQLADPNFDKPGQIDILLGANIFWKLLSVGQINRGKNLPVFQKTQLGWIVCGTVPSNFCLVTTQTHLSIDAQINSQIKRFWEFEEIHSNNELLTEEEAFAEHSFKTTTLRQADGRFIVKIPLKRDPVCLGDSYSTALSRFHSLERKLQSDPHLLLQYSNFIDEYIALGHMSKINHHEKSDQSAFYLPHHSVLKPDSLTTKLRVVFDGSAKTSSGVSVNDIQAVGPTIQDDLFSILLRFRKHKYVVTSDIAKMYRQVLVSPEQRKLQRILWRKSPDQPIDVFELNTVTYGTASAAFLAIRSVHQLATENITSFPEASSVILKDMYVDDLLTDANTIQDTLSLITQISEILAQGKFELRKWVSNSSDIIKQLTSTLDVQSLHISDSETTKTLGLIWQPSIDNFQYVVDDYSGTSTVTKRTILSCIAQIFDPLGLLGPLIIKAKFIVQVLWHRGLSWDESLPLDLHTQWREFRSSLSHIQSVRIPRYVLSSHAFQIELHGFSDASLKAYGACVYVRYCDEFGNWTSSLLCAKSRVAPLQAITIPRLELCGALLLSELMDKIIKSMKLNFNRFYCWCDSQIVLCWINSDHNKLKTYISNRVLRIQNFTKDFQWRFIGTKDNPADLLSRGVSADQLVSCNIWWKGPQWLSGPNDTWPTQPVTTPTFEADAFEIRPSQCLATTTNFHLFDKYSSFIRLRNVVAYCLRFKHNCRNKSSRLYDPLTPSELAKATLRLIALAQQQNFSREILDLKKGSLSPTSTILCLKPFLDPDGLIRVGGRLTKGEMPYDKLHPLLLPKNHKLAELIAKHEHVRLMHAGPQTVLNSIREKYWPLSGRNLVKRVTHSCIPCFRARPRGTTVAMADLPTTRITPSPPFTITGLDYAGPLMIKDRKGRGCKLIKSYICLFICFSTKATHLELVGDLTTESFIACLRRFVSRRGRPSQLHSDNATNFTGANSELQTLLRTSSLRISEFASHEGIKWSFIPPRSPHFGGLWESNIKSVKLHLKRILGNAHLTYEEMITTLSQIESCLNSRPLSPMSNDPSDLTPLTPAHFLLGRPLTSIPDPDLTEVPENRLPKFQRAQQLLQHFWSRWSKDYLVELQTRNKWTKNSPHQLKINDLVLIKDDCTSPLKWALGRIVSLHPGSDGSVRAVSVKTSTGLVKSAAVKLCPLPIDN